jgi:hypothetical protein
MLQMTSHKIDEKEKEENGECETHERTKKRRRS